MKNRRNYYRLLQVQPDAPFEVIRSAYRTLLLELKKHPDLGGDHLNAQALNEAYSILSDSNKRDMYDKKLFESYTKTPFSGTDHGKKPIITLFCPFCKRPLAREARPNERCLSCQSPLKSATEKEVKQDCRRSVARKKKSGKVRYFTAWPQKGLEADLIDISPKGMRFKSPDKLMANSVIKISSPELRAIAKVKNSHKIFLNGKTVYAVGVHFLSVTFSKQAGSFYSATV